MGHLEIVSFVDDREYDLPRLCRRLQQTFRTDVQLVSPDFGLEFALDAARNQYLSTSVLSKLLEVRTEGATKTLAITDVDLFIPILTYVFGEAQLGGSVAVVSVHRLRPSFYGLRDDAILLRERLVKEAVHELGHTFGLLHCPDQTCVITSSTYAENIDHKTTQFCSRCQILLNERLPERR